MEDHMLEEPIRYEEPEEEDPEEVAWREANETPYQRLARKYPELYHAEIVAMLQPPSNEECPF